MKQPIDKARISIHPMKDPIPTPDACYVDVEILFDNHWWSEAGRNFHLTPGENRKRAEAWARAEAAALAEHYEFAPDALELYL